jgi:hypothetical protein
MRKDFKIDAKKGVEVGIARSLFIIPVLLIGAVISVPVGFIVNSVWRRREQRFVRVMQAKNRLINWPDFMREVNRKCGTTIIERLSIKGRTRWWWTPDDISAKSPHPVEGSSSSFPDPVFTPFHEWCHEIYTNATTGRAMLVSCTPEERRSFKDNISTRHAVTVWRSREARINHVRSVV